MTTHSRQCSDECWLQFCVPGGVACRQVCGGEWLSEEQHEAEEAQETGSRAVNRAGAPVALCLETQVGARFLEGDLDLPATEIPRDDLEHRHRVVGTEEGERVALAGRVTQQHPADWERLFAVAVPQCALRCHLHRELLAGIPVDLSRQPGGVSWAPLREAVLPLDLTQT